MGVNRSNIEQFQLRLPPGLRDRLKAAADANGRSLNSEIVARVERVISPDADGWVRFYLPPRLISRIEESARRDGTTPEVEIRVALEDKFPEAPNLCDLFSTMKRRLDEAGDDADPTLREFVKDTLKKFKVDPVLGAEPLIKPEMGYEVGPDEE